MLRVEYRGGTPRRATELAAGYDLRSAEAVLIPAGGIVAVSTGLRLCLPPDHVALLFARSGLASHGVTLANGVGVIDADYQGEVKALLHNISGKPYQVSADDRIAQIVLLRHEVAAWAKVAQFVQSERGEGGFGSTGRV